MPVRPNIAAMSGYTPGEQPQAGKFIKLNMNENPYPPSHKVVQAIQAVLEQGLAKYPDPIANSFRRRAAEVLGVEPDWILCGNGSDDILTILTRAFVGEGDLLRLPYPSYVLYRTLAEIQGARHEEVRFDESRVLSVDWLSYPILDMTQVPDSIDVVLVGNHGSRSYGAGEPSTRPVAAALANALFDATGRRLRRVPFTPERLRAALAGPPTAA